MNLVLNQLPCIFPRYTNKKPCQSDMGRIGKTCFVSQNTEIIEPIVSDSKGMLIWTKIIDDANLYAYSEVNGELGPIVLTEMDSDMSG